MNALEHLLRTRTSGLVHVPLADLHDLADVVRRLGWRSVDVDTSHAGDKAELMDVVTQALHLADWFGRTWDSLADVLSDVEHQPGTVLVWIGREALPAEVAETFAEILAERADDAAQRVRDDAPDAGAFLVVVPDGGTPGA